jgi:hypothetical protein
MRISEIRVENRLSLPSPSGASFALSGVESMQGTSRKVFIIGCGRSGTHWVAEILASYRELHVEVESDPIFGEVIRLALEDSTDPADFQRLISLYEEAHRAIYPRYFVDKSHPNLWLAERLAQSFPDSLFVGVQRSVYGTVASMLRHSGVQQWFSWWEQTYKRPCRFLGISEEEVKTYSSRSLLEKCTLRWASHAVEMMRVSDSLGDRCCVLGYEDTVENPHMMSGRLEKFLAVTDRGPLPQSERVSLHKWRSQLDAADIADIDGTLERIEFPIRELEERQRSGAMSAAG